MLEINARIYAHMYVSVYFGHVMKIGLVSLFSPKTFGFQGPKFQFFSFIILFIQNIFYKITNQFSINQKSQFYIFGPGRTKKIHNKKFLLQVNPLFTLTAQTSFSPKYFHS